MRAARNDERSRCLYRVGVLALHQANARLGPAGGRARGQAQEGHLFRASPGHDRPSDYTTGLPSTAAPGYAAQRAAEDEELLSALRRATSRRARSLLFLFHLFSSLAAYAAATTYAAYAAAAYAAYAAYGGLRSLQRAIFCPPHPAAFGGHDGGYRSRLPRACAAHALLSEQRFTREHRTWFAPAAHLRGSRAAQRAALYARAPNVARASFNLLSARSSSTADLRVRRALPEFAHVTACHSWARALLPASVPSPQRRARRRCCAASRR
jgi:hypothetical protein